MVLHIQAANYYWSSPWPTYPQPYCSGQTENSDPVASSACSSQNVIEEENYESPLSTEENDNDYEPIVSFVAWYNRYTIGHTVLYMHILN